MITKRDTLFLKGLSILLLVFHHNWLMDGAIYPIKANLRIVVWIFLFISAYGLSSQIEKLSPKHYFKFVLKRLALLYIPLWICNIVILIINLCVAPVSVVEYYSGPLYIWILDLFNLSFYFGTPAFVSGWYISMLLLIIVLFPGIYFVVTKLKWFSVIPVLLIVWFFKWKIYYTYGGYLDEYLMIVVIGILFYKYKVFSRCPKISGIWRWPAIAGAAVIFFVLLCLRNEYISYVSENIYLRFDPFSTAFAIFVIAAVYMLRSDDKASLLFEKLGTYSADIFYIHSVFYNVVFPKAGLTDPYLAFIICFSASLLISVLIEKGKDLIGFNKKLRSGLDRLLKTGA
ncbi:MAG: acyltransferase [Clostridiales bacterium]|nr:acyltransferase [Clostridiales bacterium]